MKKQLLFHFIFLFSFYFGHSQLSEGFENTTGPDPSPSTNWTLGSGNWFVFGNGIGATRWGINSGTATPPLVYNGVNAAYMNRDQTGGAGLTSEDYLATPLVTFPANGKLRFFSRTFTPLIQGTIYQIKVYSGSSAPTNPSNYITIAEFTEDQIATSYDVYEQKIISLPANLAGTQGHIAFVRKNTQATATIDGDRWLVDDVGIYEGCLEPTNLATTGVFFNSVNLTWSNPSGATSWEIEVLPAAATPTGFGVLYNGGLPFLASTTSYGSPLIQNPLTHNTSYKYYIRAVCTGNILSDWVGPFNFTTAVGTPGCGDIFTDNGGATNFYANNSDETIVITPSIPGGQVKVSFTSFNTEQYYDTLSIYNGNVATPSALLGTYSSTFLPPTFVSTHPSGCLTFKFVSNGSVNSYGWEAKIECSTPTCLIPTQLYYTTSLGTPQLSWVSSNPNSLWHVAVYPCGSPAPDATTQNYNVTTYNLYYLTNLAPSSCYNLYVRSVCSSTEKSPWSAPITIYTPAAPITCGSIFTDSGGEFTNYANNSDNTVTICPTNTNTPVTVTFTSFETEVGRDALYVYNGNSTNSSQIPSTNPAANVPGGLGGGYWGTTLPGPFTGNQLNGGCLTFRFRSDGFTNKTGWKANVTCGPVPDRFVLVAFVDVNNNGIRDNGEYGFSNGSFVWQVNNTGPINYVTSYWGSHALNNINSANSYDFSYSINSNLASYLSCSTTYNDISITPGIGTQTIYFPITVNTQYTDVSVILNSGTPRPGFEYTNTIFYKNNGFITASGSLNFVKDPAVTIISISQTGTIPNATGFSFNYSNLLPNEQRLLHITMSVPPIPIVNLGDILTNSVAITTTGNDIDLTNNTASTSRIVEAALDPNDKSESHGPQIQFNQFTTNDYLYYTVNFQNEGTANALTVRIEDVLDAKLDETSIRMLVASHPYVMHRINNQITWTFNNINLPPKSVSELLSKGYVIFQVKLKPGFAVGDVIPNTAHIYFDTNPAIITNTFNTQFVALNNPNFDSGNFIISPNPATNIVEILLQNTSETIDSIAITDVLGKTIRSIKTISNNQAQIDVSSFSKGIYFVEITTDTNLKQVKKLVIK